MKVSLIIPFLDVPAAAGFPSKREQLKRCVGSMNGYDELIIIPNDMGSLAKKINLGLEIATGDYLIMANDDLILLEGTLQDLCNNNAVTSPKINGQFKEFSGHMWCLPRWVYEKVGGYDERYKNAYYDDEDYKRTLISNNIQLTPSKTVNVHHGDAGQSIKAIETWQQDEEFNKNLFTSKWNS